MLLVSDIGLQLTRGWSYLTSGRTLAIILGVGFALLAIFLLLASRTKWGQTKPLAKCVVLSVLAHVWLLMYALGNRPILPQGNPQAVDQHMSVAFEAYNPPAEIAPTLAAAETQDESVQGREWEQPVPLAELPKPAELDALLSASTAPPAEALPSLEPTPLPALPPPEPLVDPSQQERVSTDSQSFDSSQQLTSELPSQPSIEPVAQALAAAAVADSLALGEQAAAVEQSQASGMNATSMRQSQATPKPARAQDPHLPHEYQLRTAENRLQLTQAFGADADTEAAVAAGLRWLAQAQADDGGWNAKQHGAGTETYALGEYRHGTGDRADTAVSGLAILAFLSAGHTHLEGEYQQTVQRGLQYLLHAQMPSGDLSGPKQVGNAPSVMYARMYSHSIAALALAEAHAMTHDALLRDALIRAAQYSINAQDVRGGGWRYKPGDTGDLSQFGWQAMALRSVENSGIKIPIEVKRRMPGFLDSCMTGRYGGLARYRPQDGPPSPTMTAEALACRLLLGYPLTDPARREATQMLLANLPGATEDNVYYWYYATLALFQLQDESWRQWNQALKTRLLTSQEPAYSTQPGSWQPDSVWGGYGGRVYSTAMSCLCLEVYYRYLPMYQRSNLASQQSGWSPALK